MNPINLALRFALELGALTAIGWWGSSLVESGWRWVFGLALVFGVAAVWGTFAVPGDPSRGGEGVVHVPGSVRLLIELAVFAAGAYALRAMERPGLALAFAGLVVAHYLWSYQRIMWLLGRG
jgi:hypothetical protein